jgi:hypothetical protein
MFCWVSHHVRLFGCETTDGIAREATCHVEPGVRCVPVPDIKRAVHKKLFSAL